MNIAVIIPSALRTRPGTDELWLARALRSVQVQTYGANKIEVIIGLDPGAVLATDAPVRVAHGHIKGHQAACNAAAKMATAPLLAFLEDDDEWEPDHLEQMAKAAAEYQVPFVTASQLEVTPDGVPIREFHFATMSSWLISRLLWMQMGGVNERFQIHHDNEFLIRAKSNLLDCHPPIQRVHLIPESCLLPESKSVAWLGYVERFAHVVAILPHYTVRRTVHAESVLAACQHKPERVARSQKEYAALDVYHGTTGW